MSKPAETESKVYLATVVYDSGVMHMWTSLLALSDPVKPKPDNLRNAALSRFRCFASKHLVGVDIGTLWLYGPTLVVSFPGRFSRNKTITDVLNYFSKDAEGQLSGKLFVWGMPFNKTFRLLEGPVIISSKENPRLFPEVCK